MTYLRMCMRRVTVRTMQEMVTAHRQERYFLYSSGLEDVPRPSLSSLILSNTLGIENLKN